METLAYFVALLNVMFLTPALFLWLFIHPFAAWWRRLNLSPVVYFTIMAVYFAVLAAVIFWFREPILRVRFGVSVPLTIIAIPLLIFSQYIRFQHRKHLKPAVMLGLPEVTKDRPGKLLTEGIYGKIRHPRYVEVEIALTAIALFCNYLAVYILLATMVPAFYLVVILEERELKDRFGEEYEQYCRRVPRFVPRPGKRPG